MAPRAATLLGVLLVLAGPALALDGIIQPGERLVAGGALCTMAFIADGTGSKAGKVYAITAAHCVGPAGTRASTFGSPEGGFGTIALRGPWVDDGGCGSPRSEDYALVEVDEAQENRVVPWVKGHPEYPTGVTTPSQTVARDLLQFSGYGTGWTAHNVTREERVGLLSFDDSTFWGGLATATPGDSGGPVVHVPTGKALGLVNCLGAGTSTNTGVTIAHVLDRAAAQGFGLVVRTV